MPGNYFLPLFCLGISASTALADPLLDAASDVQTIVITGGSIDHLGAKPPALSSASPAASSDTASLLGNTPGVSLQGAGGVSGLPAIHGLADDRLRIKVDGMDLVSACANHMNPPLSYIDPAQVEQIEVYAGIAPVSLGGDSIGGTIVVKSEAPVFAGSSDELLRTGKLSAFYRSNGNSTGGNIAATLASEKLSLHYTGTTAQSDNFEAADSFKLSGSAAPGRGWLDGDEVGSTAYKTNNQSINIALQHAYHLLELRFSEQHIPYQGFPNQRMDMTNNRGKAFNLHYRGEYDWGMLESRIYHERTRHRMNFGDDKQFTYGNAPGMPMETLGKNTGAILKADIHLHDKHMLHTGLEYQRYRLDDWWPPSGTGMMMSPNTFWNIRNGERVRYDAYLELESWWDTRWQSSLGMRSANVRMDSDDVQGYSNTNGMGMMTHNYLAESTAFNQRSHQRSDHNLDITALLRYEASHSHSIEAGFSRKSRSPNLYERYSWSTSGMSMRMVNLVGDGNGYVGNLDLKPETAHTLSLTASWHDPRRAKWSAELTPHISYIDDFIDAERCISANANCNAASLTATRQFVYLRYANHDARLYGMDLSGFYLLNEGQNNNGKLVIKGMVSWLRGKNLTTDDGLYNIMPLNLKLALEHDKGRWHTVLESELGASKYRTSEMRNELKTDGYAIFNLRTRYTLSQWSFDVGIDNLTDKFYNPPLGGAYVGQGTTMSGTAVPYGIAVPGMGRSFYTAATFRF